MSKFDFTLDHAVVLNRAIGESGRVLKPEVLASAFAGLDYAADEVDKLCMVVRSIMQGHPFVDGNKRTGMVLLCAGYSTLTGRPVRRTEDEVVHAAVESVIQRWTPIQYRQWVSN